MAQNSRFSDKIDREATKMLADAHLQNDLPGKGIPLKTTQIFLTIFWELYSVVLKSIWRVVLPLMHMEGFQQRWFVKYNNLAQQEYFIIGLATMHDVAILYNSVFTHAHYIE